MKKLYLLLLFLPVFGFSQYTITGIVQDENKLPISYAEVILKASDSIPIKSELSNEKGKFRINTIKRGLYTLTIKYFGEIIFSKSIAVNNDIALGTIITNESISLDEVVVISKTKLKKKLGKYVLTNIAASKFSKNKSTFEFLNVIPMVDASIDGSSIKIKNKGEATILINGKKMGSHDIALSMLKSIPTTEIKKIEIQKTAGSKYSASNKNGIINIILKKNSKQRFKGAIGVRTSQAYYNSQNINTYLSYAKKKLAISLGYTVGNHNYKSKSENTYDNFTTNLQNRLEIDNDRKRKTSTPFLNLEYTINKNQTLGFRFNSRFANNNSKSLSTNTYQQLNNQQIDSIATSTIKTVAPHLSLFYTNFNYTLKTDSLGSKLDLDFFLYGNKNNTNSINNFVFANSSTNHFLQNPNIKTTVENAKIDFKKIRINDDKINMGISYIHSKINNNFFFGNYNGNTYISDPQQSNSFSYKDMTLAGYISYEKVFNDRLEGSIGLRLEHFNAEGQTKTATNKTRTDNTYLFPSISLLYIPNDNHEFSLDFSSSVFRPSFNQLNPFIRYTSPTTSIKNNPNLLASISYEFLFNYTFFDDFSLDIEYDYDKGLFNQFDIVQADNTIQTITANYGNSSSLYLDLTYATLFFKRNWKFSASASYEYDKTMGDFNNIVLDYKDSNFSFKVKNYINLSKNNDFSLMIVYGFDSSSRGIYGKLNSLHSLETSLNKSFKNFSISIGAHDLAKTNIVLKETRKTYRFHKIRNYYTNYFINLRYLFGNKKVKRVYDKKNDFRNRLK